MDKNRGYLGVEFAIPQSAHHGQPNSQTVIDPQLCSCGSRRIPSKRNSRCWRPLLDNQAWERVADILAESIFTATTIAAYSATSQADGEEPAGRHGHGVRVDRAERGQDKTGGSPIWAPRTEHAFGAQHPALCRDRARARDPEEADRGGTVSPTPLESDGKDVAQLLDEAESRVFEIAEAGARGQQGLVEIQPILAQVMERSTCSITATTLPTSPVSPPASRPGSEDSGLQQGDLIIGPGGRAWARPRSR